MKIILKQMRWLVIHTVLFTVIASSVLAQPFIHPGIDQQSKDLAYMKKMVLAGEQPWKAAFDKLKSAADTSFVPKPHTHVLRGPYGRPNIGGDDLSKGANMAYNYALIWFITNDKKYADKAKAILNAWSPVLWDFDYNDAKLLAAWTGHLLCNAAEILRYTNAGWQQKDIGSFTNMLMTAYYPLLRYYFTQANGNWDGAIVHSLLAMGVFTNNRAIFNNAVDHFLHAPVNGSIFKYIYPGGQCQESMRDQAHVQLGLGEFAGAAQIAYTQGVDLFSLADNRLALGFEYTAQFLLGKTPHSYGKISERAKTLRDDYEYVYRHYTAHGVELPYVKIAADSVRAKASRSVLTAVRSPVPAKAATAQLKIVTTGNTAGAGSAALSAIPASAIIVAPGQSVQHALDEAGGNGRWVILKAGIHNLPATLKMPSDCTLAGEGLGSILFLDPSGGRDAMVNGAHDMHDITIRDLVIEGSNKTETGDDPNSNRSFKGGYNRGGIIFRALKEAQMNNINLINLTLQNCTYNGVFISGGANINIIRCNFNENGGNAVPGPKLQHNLLLTHSKKVNIEDSRLTTSPYGSGVALDHCTGAVVTRCEIARNGYYGMLVTESKNITIKENLIEGNDRSGIMLEYLYKGSENISISNNQVHFNNGYGVESYSAINSKISRNHYAGNGRVAAQEKISREKHVILE